jgi:hypothetical protein
MSIKRWGDLGEYVTHADHVAALNVDRADSARYWMGREQECRAESYAKGQWDERQRCIDLLVDEVDSIYRRLPSVDGALLEGLRWAVEYLHDTRSEPVDEPTP